MWPFSKSQPDISTLPPVSAEPYEWQLAMANTKDGPLIVRKNSSAQVWAKHPKLTIKLGFAIPLNAPNQGGLPDPDENEQLDEIEDLIVTKLSGSATDYQRCNERVCLLCC